jgi:hypothetical protein
LLDFRKELGAYFARKTTDAADHVFEEKGYTEDDLERWLHE